MRAFGFATWKRWIATLCVALLAFVLVEDAFAVNDPCHAAGGAVYYNVATMGTPDGDAGSPADGAPTLHQHHCCGAHATGLAAADNAAAFQSARPVGPTYSDHFAPSGDPNGLDRPPKPSASA